MGTPFARTTRALDADHGARSLMVMAVALVLLAAWAAWFFLARVTVAETSRSARIEVSTAARAIAAPQSGRVTASGLYVGRKVRKGEVLLELDAEPQKLRLAQAEAVLAAYPARLAGLRSELASSRSAVAGSRGMSAAEAASARARVREAGAAADFSRELAGKQAIDSANGGAAPIEAARTSADAARAAAARDALAQDAARSDSAGAVRLADRQTTVAQLDATIAAIEGEAAAAQRLVDQLRFELEQRRIRAPADGVIGDVAAIRLGEFIAAGTSLGSLIPDGDLQIVAGFDPATGLGRIAPGQRARLRLDGFAWTQYGEFPASVLRVGGEGLRNSLRVELRVPRRSTRDLPLRHGMTGRVVIDIEQVTPAILLLRAIGQVAA